MQGGRRVAIVGGNRIPFARAGGPYATASSLDLLAVALEGLVDRFDLAGERLGEVAAGAVLRHPRDLTLTREAVLRSRLDPTTPAYDVLQACATSLQATVAVAHKIAAGEIEVGVAGGVDSASPRSADCAPATSCLWPPAPSRPPPGCRWASTPRSPPSSGASVAASRTSWRSPPTTGWRRRTTRGCSTTW